MVEYRPSTTAPSDTEVAHVTQQLSSQTGYVLGPNQYGKAENRVACIYRTTGR